MRDVPPSLAARLVGGATTHCHVWKLTRADGVTFGFTDHDRDLTIDGVIYAARSGLDAAEAEAALGLAATSADVAGVFVADALSEADLANGRFDDATVERWLVDWSDVALRLLLDVATVGEVRRAQDRFAAELRAPTHLLDQERGRLYLGVCATEFGDARCGLDRAPWSAATAVLPGSTASRLRLAPVALPADPLAIGVVTLTSGAQAGVARRARACRLVDGALDCALWTPFAAPPEEGAAATLTIGCDKRYETCRDRFANAVNFRGFPHIPGADYMIRAAIAGDPSADGGLAR